MKVNWSYVVLCSALAVAIAATLLWCYLPMLVVWCNLTNCME